MYSEEDACCNEPKDKPNNKANDDSKNETKNNNSHNNNNVVVPNVIFNNANPGTDNQGIKYSFVQDRNGINLIPPLPAPAPIIAQLEPMQTKIGDRVKLDAMFQLYIKTEPNSPVLGEFTFALFRSTLLLGQTTPVTALLTEVTIRDSELNSGQNGGIYTRLVSLTWTDTPPTGISTYIINLIRTGIGGVKVALAEDRALNAVIFPIDTALS